MKNPEKPFEDLVKETRGHFDNAKKKLKPFVNKGMPEEKSELDVVDEKIKRTIELRNLASSKKNTEEMVALSTYLGDLEKRRDELIRKGAV